VLEIGSGPGWDADHLERGGLSVRRTDVTETFRTFQTELGRQIEALDVLTDDLGGPYDGVLMLYVLQHLAAAATRPVFDKIAGALRPGGWFLLSFREGEAEIWEGGSRDYWVVERPWAAVAAQLREAGLVPAWDTPNTDSDGSWRIVLARRGA
jgi:SAM-dependent methyltransferase